MTSCVRPDSSPSMREVITAVWVMSAGREAHAIQRSLVTLSDLDAATLEWYLDSGEWQGKAGAYGIQGRAAAFIPTIEGSHSSVMGLPLHETHVLLRGFGMDC
jgi:septum formation protein